MLKLTLRDPKTEQMEVHIINTRNFAQMIPMILEKWPESRVSAMGEIIVTRSREVETRFGTVIREVAWMVAKIEFEK